MFWILFYGYINMFIYFLACCGIVTIVATFYAGGFLTKKDMDDYDNELDQRKQKLALINQKDNDQSMTIKVSHFMEDTQSGKSAKSVKNLNDSLSISESNMSVSRFGKSSSENLSQSTKSGPKTPVNMK